MNTSDVDQSKKRVERFWFMRRPRRVGTETEKIIRREYERLSGDTAPDGSILSFVIGVAETMNSSDGLNVELADRIAYFLTGHYHTCPSQEMQARAKEAAINLYMLVFETVRDGADSWELFNQLAREDFGRVFEEILSRDKVQYFVEVINELK